LNVERLSIYCATEVRQLVLTTLATRVTVRGGGSTMPVNHQIVYHLQDALNLSPDLMDPWTTQSFESSTNDQILVVYLSILLRAVIVLHALVDNKATIGKVELEEGGAKDSNTKKEEDSVGESTLRAKNRVSRMYPLALQAALQPVLKFSSSVLSWNYIDFDCYYRNYKFTTATTNMPD